MSGRGHWAEDRLQKLVIEVRRYLDNPGCNLNSRRTAMERLRFAADEASKVDICAKCGHPRVPHNYRHRFVQLEE